MQLITQMKENQYFSYFYFSISVFPGAVRIGNKMSEREFMKI